MPNGTFDANQLDWRGHRSPLVSRPLRQPYNVLILTNDSADAETVVIGSTTYEFDTDSSVTSGNVPVDVSGGVTPTLSGTALVTAINARIATDGWSAYKLSANEVVVWKIAPGAESTATTFSDTMGGANNGFISATALGASDGGVLMDVQSRVAHADEIATTNGLVFVTPFVPDRVIAYFVDATTGAVVTDIKITITDNGANGIVNIEESGTAFASSDIIVMVALKSS